MEKLCVICDRTGEYFLQCKCRLFVCEACGWRKQSKLDTMRCVCGQALGELIEQRRELVSLADLYFTKEECEFLGATRPGTVGKYFLYCYAAYISLRVILGDYEDKLFLVPLYIDRLLCRHRENAVQYKIFCDRKLVGGFLNRVDPHHGMMTEVEQQLRRERTLALLIPYISHCYELKPWMPSILDESEAKKVEICVSTFSGRLTLLKVNLEYQVLTVKYALQLKMSPLLLPVDHLIFSFAGQFLENDRKLSHYGIVAGSKIYMVQQLKGD